MSINTTTTTAATTTYLNKTFYDKKLLETAKTRLVHASFGQKRSIPKNNGKRVEFRRYELFTPDANALKLQEGVTPTGQSLAQSKVEAEVKQYGAFVEVSDLLDLTAYDEVIADSAELLGEQLGTVIEWITRDAMCATTNIQYAGGNASRVALESTDKLTIEEVRKAVRTLKKNKARMFNTASDGSMRKPHFICICSPEATFDLQSDSTWQSVSAYSNAEQIYSGEIGRLFGVVFVESTEAKVYEQSVVNAVNASTTSSATFVLKNTPTEAEIAYLSKGGNKINIGSTEYTLAATESYTAATRTVKLSATASLAANAIVFSADSGAPDSTTKVAPDVHATLVFGADAYGIVDVDGKGTMETIIKPHGSSGSLDPLNQRATVGAKVMAYTAEILNPLWIVKIEHCVSN
ncbi:MAG: N4-gp56 family major capsid protein [Eubacteriales bacterium]|nr:N4-gp56 family major capsid protein [Eubacteriales bacterium]